MPRAARGGMGWETWKEECPHEWGHGSLKGYATDAPGRASRHAFDLAAEGEEEGGTKQRQKTGGDEHWGVGEVIHHEARGLGEEYCADASAHSAEAGDGANGAFGEVRPPDLGEVKLIRV